MGAGLAGGFAAVLVAVLGLAVVVRFAAVVVFFVVVLVVDARRVVLLAGFRVAVAVLLRVAADGAVDISVATRVIRSRSAGVALTRARITGSAMSCV